MPTTSILSDEELAPLLQRKRQLQATLATQGSSGSSCCGSQSGCSSGGHHKSSYSIPPSTNTAQPNVVKALAITIGVLAVSALAWWALIA